jgi:hypothetical protein
MPIVKYSICIKCKKARHEVDLERNPNGPGFISKDKPQCEINYNANPKTEEAK